MFDKITFKEEKYPIRCLCLNTSYHFSMNLVKTIWNWCLFKQISCFISSLLSFSSWNSCQKKAFTQFCLLNFNATKARNHLACSNFYSLVKQCGHWKIFHLKFQIVFSDYSNPSSPYLLVRGRPPRLGAVASDQLSSGGINEGGAWRAGDIKVAEIKNIQGLIDNTNYDNIKKCSWKY